MAKNHRIHSRPKQQTQTAAMSPPHAPTPNGGPASSSSLAIPPDDQDEDDICPVCESECTCDNRRSAMNMSTPVSHFPPVHGYARPVKAELESTRNVTGPSLKIKLVVPPSLKAKSQALSHPNKGVTSRSSHPKKQKRPVEATFASSGVADPSPRTPIGSPFSAPGQPLIPGGTTGMPSNVDASVPKKRGRPPKAAIAAREAIDTIAAAAGTEARRVAIDQTNVGAARPRKPPVPKTATTKLPAEKKRKAPTAPKTLKRKRAASVKQHASSSDLSEPDDFGYDNDDAQSLQFPTFISAMSSSSNGSSSSSSDLDSDSEFEAAKEQFKFAEDTLAREAARMRKELMGDADQGPRKWAHRNNWEIRPRKKSVGADGSSDAVIDADSDEETEEEEEEEGEDDCEDEDEMDPSVGSAISYTGVATGWSDDDAESSFDADLFFANLSDSSADASDDEMGETDAGDVDSDMDALSLTEAAAAGFLASFEGLERRGLENLEVTEGLDGQYMFTTGLKEGQGILDMEFEASAAQLGADANNVIQDLDDADIMMATSEEEEAMETLEDEDEEIGYLHDESDGDTTEDEFIELDGIPTPRNMVLLRFPASMGSIDPLSTISPIDSPSSRTRTLATSSTLSNAPQASPKPADILAGRVYQDGTFADGLFAGSGPATPSASSTAAKFPVMGAFDTERADPKKKVIVTGSSKEIPSPFPNIQRLRGRSSSWNESKRSGSGSDLGTGRSRPSSLLGANRSPYQTLVAGDFMAAPSPELSPTEPIDLDDVLDASFLESDPLDPHVAEIHATRSSDAESESRRHFQNLSRWDRIPMDTFRRTRATAGTGSLETKNPTQNWSGVSSRATQAADGFSYGSSARGMMRGSPFSTTLWEAKPSLRAEGHSGNRRDRSQANLIVDISPVILPVHDGDRTSTNEQSQYGHHIHHHHLFGPTHNTKSRKELRKEKKRNRKVMNAAAVHHHRNHYPNAKTRSTGSIQRSHFLSSSSVPPLSI